VPVITRNAQNQIAVFVLPQFIKDGHHLYNVDNEFNGVIVEGQFSGQQFLKGKGAGSYPTGAAVLSDVSALSHGYRYEFKKSNQVHPSQFSNDLVLKVYLRYNNVLDLDQFDFITINEKYTGDDYHYVVGEINLASLVNKRDYILENKLFISLLQYSKTANSETQPAKAVAHA